MAGTVLIVDDDSGVRETLRDVVAYAGYEVVTACDGASALAYLRDNPPPVAILLDLMMPTMDGAAFRKAQLADERLCDIPVVLLTAAGEANALDDVCFIRKPFDVRELHALLATLCAGR